MFQDGDCKPPAKALATHSAPSYEKFQELQTEDDHGERFPLVIKGHDFGPCREKWTAGYLASTGGDKPVTVHVCGGSQMDFIHKNFSYQCLPFAEFVQRASQSKQDKFFLDKTEKYYLRSLGSNPRSDKADLRTDFPRLAPDIKFPPYFREDQFFSSVFRIASEGVQLWTHYDVMDNVLMVVSGRKRVVLFPPKEALYLYLNGDKSEVLDIDHPDLQKYPEFVKATRYECVLNSGDILFIPAFWFHNVINLHWGVAVNVFWRHLEEKHYDPKDVYGNNDLLPGKHAISALDRAVGHLNKLPRQYRDFYGRRLIQRITEKLLIDKETDNCGETAQQKEKHGGSGDENKSVETIEIVSDKLENL